MGFLQGKRALVVGVASSRSIAYGVAKAMHREGAELAFGLTVNGLVDPDKVWRKGGLKPGDRWCLCAPRWLQAHEQDMAPKVFLTRTHRRALETVPLEVLRRYAADLN